MFTVLVNNKQKRQKPVDEQSVSPPRLGRCARSSQAGIDVAIAPIAMLSEASLIAQSSNEGEASNADVSSWIEDCSGTVVLLPVPVRRGIEALAEDDGNAVPQTADAVTKPDSAASAVQVAREDDALASALMAAPDAAVSSQETCVTAVLDVAMTQSERAETANVQDGALLGIVAIELATLAGTNGHSWGDAADRDRIEPTRSEPMVVAEPVELAPTQAGGYVVSPWMQAEPAVASLLQSHPPLGSTPLTNKFLEQRRPPDTDPFSAIRRMSLPEKIEFFS